MAWRGSRRGGAARAGAGGGCRLRPRSRRGPTHTGSGRRPGFRACPPPRGGTGGRPGSMRCICCRCCSKLGRGTVGAGSARCMKTAPCAASPGTALGPWAPGENRAGGHGRNRARGCRPTTIERSGLTPGCSSTGAAARVSREICRRAVATGRPAAKLDSETATVPAARFA